MGLLKKAKKAVGKVKNLGGAISKGIKGIVGKLGGKFMEKFQSMFNGKGFMSYLFPTMTAGQMALNNETVQQALPLASTVFPALRPLAMVSQGNSIFQNTGSLTPILQQANFGNLGNVSNISNLGLGSLGGMKV